MSSCNGGDEKIESDPGKAEYSQTAPLDPDSGSHAFIGQFILAEPDVSDFKEKTGYQPPIVAYMADWIPDEKLKGWIKKPKNQMELAAFDTSVGDTVKRLLDDGSISALGWSIPLTHWDIKPKHLNKVPNVVSITAGNYDKFIASYARQVKAFGRPLMMTFLPEFNNYGETSFGEKGNLSFDDRDVKNLTSEYGDPDFPDGPERVRDAISHVIDIFNKEGATNVQWYMYGSTHYMMPDDDAGNWWNHPKYYYPGDDYIDWVGKSVHFTTMQEFVDRFEAGYLAWGEITDKPVFIPEFSFHQKKQGREGLYKKIFEEYLHYRNRFKAAAFYHSPIGEKYGIDFGTPLGGKKGKFKSEIEVWKQVVSENQYYRNSISNNQ